MVSCRLKRIGEVPPKRASRHNDCMFLFYIHLKLELLTQFPALKHDKILVFMKK